MTLSMYQASVPVFVRALGNLADVLKKGEAHAKSKNVTDEVLLQTRLIPDMLPLVKQVQIAADIACRGAARLAGAEPMSFEDNETTLEQIYSRIDRAIEYIKTFKPEQIDGSEDRPIALSIAGTEVKFTGQQYLLHFAMANFYFHCTTTHAILRQSGVEVGKRDFLGM